MTFHARPGINGSTVPTMFEEACKVRDALIEAKQALCFFRSEVLHGRNYQHLRSGGDLGRAVDLEKLQEMFLKLDTIENELLNWVEEVREEFNC